MSEPLVHTRTRAEMLLDKLSVVDRWLWKLLQIGVPAALLVQGYLIYEKQGELETKVGWVIGDLPPPVSPDVISVRFEHKADAEKLQAELTDGEEICLDELSDGGLRWWVHSC